MKPALVSTRFLSVPTFLGALLLAFVFNASINEAAIAGDSDGVNGLRFKIQICNQGVNGVGGSIGFAYSGGTASASSGSQGALQGQSTTSGASTLFAPADSHSPRFAIRFEWSLLRIISIAWLFGR